MMKRAFTLIEVNLAILVMAGGILSVVVLYSLGFRESSQSREDIVSASYADAVLGPLIGALSDRELTWTKFDNICNGAVPANGWGGYLDSSGKVKSGGNEAGFSAADNFATIQKPDCPCGLVICHEKGTGLVRIGFRAARRWADLLSAPLYYTEVRFQGVQDSE